MKKELHRKNILQSLLSAAVLALFIWMAVGSTVDQKVEYLGDGVYRVTKSSQVSNSTQVMTGRRDSRGRWHGDVNIEITDQSGKKSVEKVAFASGLRHGQSVMTMSNGQVKRTCYNIGRAVDCPKADGQGKDGLSAFEKLENKFPWFVLYLEGLGHSWSFAEEFVDALVREMTSQTLSLTNFNSRYEDALWDLEDEEEFEQIVLDYEFLVDAHGIEVMKNNEFRRAVVDRYLMGVTHTFDVVSETFPGYLAMMEGEFSTPEFQAFCDELDSRMLAVGNLDPDDPLFVDSIDTRLYRVLEQMVRSKAESKSLHAAGEPINTKEAKRELRNFPGIGGTPPFGKASKADPSDVAIAIATQMREEIDQADPLRISVREFFFPEEVWLADLSTEISGHVSASEVEVTGFVHDDGGGSITERGFVYAHVYNPTVEDNKVQVGEGLGTFIAKIGDLQEGLWFIRSYAINTAGVAYGNQVEFSVESTTGILDPANPISEMIVYPVPASGMLQVAFHHSGNEKLVLSLINTSGQVVHKQEVVGHGKQQLTLSLEGLNPGVYFVRLASATHRQVQRVVVR